ncbi:LysR substrate-binding domain-containing protein [Saccharospirillum sp. HFRX-1]|uniref:LysR family transcriptional regulator n=1 Tax=unclassified Saccharospirillum TaxID=2633430 RepID=UPI003714D27F
MFLERRHLQSLQAIDEAGSLAKAAERLHVTQSALSHQIKGLEHYFDVSLFLRHTKPIKLSPAGRKLLELAEAVLPRIAAVENEMTRLASGEAGRLYIAIECHACYDWLMPVLARFKQAWPGVEVDIRLGLSFDSITALRAGELDLVISSDPIEAADLIFRPMFNYEGRLILPDDHRLAERDFIRAEDLQQEHLISYPVSRDRLDVFKHFLTPAGIEPKSLRQSELTAVILLLVASGRGITALPDWVLRYSQHPTSLVSRKLGENGLHGKMYSAIRSSDANSQYLADFAELAGKFGPGGKPPVEEPAAVV